MCRVRNYYRHCTFCLQACRSASEVAGQLSDHVYASGVNPLGMHRCVT